MLYRAASVEDCPKLAALNAQLIQDEGHRNPMTIAQLEDRMRAWLLSGEYQALLWEDNAEGVAYALFRDTATAVYLRQFFVVRHRRREGIGRQAIEALCTQVWSCHKRWTVSVLVQNAPEVAFWRTMGYTDYTLTLEIMPQA